MDVAGEDAAAVAAAVEAATLYTSPLMMTTRSLTTFVPRTTGRAVIFERVDTA